MNNADLTNKDATLLIEAHANLIHSRALHWNSLNWAVDVDDLVQEGRLGLLHAHRKFNPSFGRSFSSYAFQWVDERMRRYCWKNRVAVRIPQEKFGKEHLRVTSMDVRVGKNKDVSLLDIMAAPEPEALLSDCPDTMRLFRDAVQELEPRERHIITGYLTNRTSKDMAAEMRISRQRIEQIKKEAITSLRHSMKAA